MRKKIFAIGMVVSLLLAVLGGLSLVTAQGSSVTRTLPSGAQTAGSTITVSLDVVVGSATYYAIDSVVPTGWTVTSASDAGDFTADPGHVKWVVTAGATDKTYTYTVTIPGDAAGGYTFTGVYAMEGVSSTAIGGDTTVTVGAPTQGAIRTLPSGDQTAGSTIMVSLDVVVGSATYYAIDSVVPTGWTVTSASDAGDFTADPGHVKWVVTAGATDKTYTYTVTIPGDAAGGYTFTGVYAMEGVSSTAIGGDTVVTVVPSDGVVIVINEFVSTPGVTQTSEWIELYTLKDDVSLDGWTIEDGTGSSESLTGETVVENYLVLYKSEGDFGFALNDLGDTIILKNGTTEVDRVAYGNWDDGDTADNAPAPDEDNSTGRLPNGVDTDVDIDDFTEFEFPTPEEENIIPPPIMCGDVAPYPDGNKVVDMGDVVRLLNHVSNPGDFPVDLWTGDCKCTGTINMGDVILLLNYVGNPVDSPLDCCEL